jgi:hypothetical protein
MDGSKLPANLGQVIERIIRLGEKVQHGLIENDKFGTFLLNNSEKKRSAHSYIAQLRLYWYLTRCSPEAQCYYEAPGITMISSVHQDVEVSR